MADIILNGLSPEDLLSKIDCLISARLNEAINRLKDEQPEKLLSVEETCSLFVPKITRQTLHNWTSQGLIKSHSIGRNVFYKLSDIMAAAKPLNRIVRTLKAA
jgi:hypothetical protein